ncbi:hypothetical protein [Fusicatenibacter saccharivorans]|uniref:hypothetical protein n=1 Tax=Fusicatenibacter saccharivorans TaxID=1150298 RepID=UPI0034A438E3|nr:phage portal protein [bacterium MSK18_59]
MTIEPYIKQYAEAKKKRLLNNDLIRKERKEDAIKRIDRAVKMRERGLITEDDCIIRICDCIKY